MILSVILWYLDFDPRLALKFFEKNLDFAGFFFSVWRACSCSVVKVHIGVATDELIATPKVYIVRCGREEGIAKS